VAEVQAQLDDETLTREKREADASQAKQSTMSQRKREVTRLMLHKLAGHIGGAAGIRHVRTLDPTLEVEEGDSGHSEPTCGACTFAKMKRAPVGSGPHTPWGNQPGEAVALDWVEKITSVGATPARFCSRTRSQVPSCQRSTSRSPQRPQ
jgi:hypothetical protein